MVSDICYVCGTCNMRGSVCLTCCPDGDPRLKPANTPVAPVSPDATGKCGELVTAAWQRKHPTEGWMDCREEDIPHYRDRGQEVRELSPRSQAEELLAAARAEKDGWKELHDAAQVAVKERTEACNNLYKQVNDLKADNAAKDARIKELEETKAVIAADKKILLDLAATNGDKVTALEAKLAAAKDLISRAQEIIPGNYMHWHDFARAVLGGKPS